MKLVLIEGPGKQEAIQKYLGKDYLVIPTKGHIRDLPVKTLAVDVNNRFEPHYEIVEGKEKLIADLKKKAEKAEAIYIATDPDREGEAIAWHILTVLGLELHAPVRTAFNEIQKDVILDSIAHPRSIDYNTVAAQTARRVLDRLMGYKLSPLLSRKIKGNLSAGRVQSVALKIIVDREKKIKDFVPEEYWDLSVELQKQGEEKVFKSDLVSFNDKKFEIKNETEMNTVLEKIKQSKKIVSSVERKVVQGKAPAPYITSKLQQDAISKLKFSTKQYTTVAQALYEGVNIEGEGKVALITYIRTDSTRVSSAAQAMAKDYIISKYGEQYAPKKYNVYASKKNAQDAHEAIRPINLARTPESLKGKIDKPYLALYTLIFNRFVASQMVNAEYNSLTVNINAGEYGLKASGKALKFDGFTKVYKEDENDKEGINIPSLEVGEEVFAKEYKPEQKFTKPPVRFTEGTILKEMEDNGIGRPSTYAATVLTIINRKYVEKDSKTTLIPTELGIQVTDYLEKYFQDFMNIKFTADMEDNLDSIEEGKMNWRAVVSDFYKGFEQLLFNAYKNGEKIKIEPQKSGINCEKCGAMMVYRAGKFGQFLACSNYPKCKNTKPLEEKSIDESLKGKCPKCGGTVSRKRSKKGKNFFGCDNFPNCDFMNWDLPLDKRCPKCGKELYFHQNLKQKVLKCKAEGCDYTEELEKNEE